MKGSIKFWVVVCVFIGLLLVHLSSGNSFLSTSDFYHSLFHYDSSNTHHLIARDLRFTRAMTAIVAGASLSLSGLLMQTIFGNPLAEPNILGVSTGASLFVALTMLLGIQFLYSDWGIISSALLGAFLFGLLILLCTRFVSKRISLLLIGIMLGSFSASILSILHVWSDAHRLKSFALWSMGSLQHTTFSQLPVLLLVFFVGVLCCYFFVRPLNALLLGEANAYHLGINVRLVRIGAILMTSILTGVVTAFCGPIAFVGMAVPNIVKMLFKTSHHLILITASVLLGAGFLLFCDIVVQLLASVMLVPINALTSMVGAPFVVFIILKHWT